MWVTREIHGVNEPVERAVALFAEDTAADIPPFVYTKVFRC